MQATALATIGKFVIKKKVGEKEAIFGSVTAQEIVEAIRLQVGATPLNGPPARPAAALPAIPPARVPACLWGLWLGQSRCRCLRESEACELWHGAGMNGDQRPCC